MFMSSYRKLYYGIVSPTLHNTHVNLGKTIFIIFAFNKLTP